VLGASTHVGLHLAHETKRLELALAAVRPSQQELVQGRRVREALQNRVEKAGVAQILQPRANGMRLCPLQ